MTVAILDPFSGIAGDMLLGALIDVGLDKDWLCALPERLGLRSEEHTSELQSRHYLACRLLLEKKLSSSTPLPSAKSPWGPSIPTRRQASTTCQPSTGAKVASQMTNHSFNRPYP